MARQHCWAVEAMWLLLFAPGEAAGDAVHDRAEHMGAGLGQVACGRHRVAPDGPISPCVRPPAHHVQVRQERRVLQPAAAAREFKCSTGCAWHWMGLSSSHWVSALFCRELTVKPACLKTITTSWRGSKMDCCCCMAFCTALCAAVWNESGSQALKMLTAAMRHSADSARATEGLMRPKQGTPAAGGSIVG